MGQGLSNGENPGANELNAAKGENTQVYAGTMVGNHDCKTCEDPQITSPCAQTFAGRNRIGVVGGMLG